MSRTDYILGLTLVTASAVAWSTAGLFTRMLQIDMPTMLFWRGIFGCIGILGFAFCVQRNVLGKFAKLGAPGWGFAAVSAFGMLCFILALRHTTVAHVAVIYAAVPFVSGVFGWLVLAERPSLRALSASTVALAGVAVMVGLGAEGDLAGDALALAMTCAMAAMMVLSRKFQTIPTLQAAALSALLSALAVLPWYVSVPQSTNEWLLLAAFGLVNSALGLALFSLGSKLLPPVETALIGALDAPLAPLWVWLVFAETPSAATLLGGFVVFSAVSLHIFNATRTSSV